MVYELDFIFEFMLYVFWFHISFPCILSCFSHSFIHPHITPQVYSLKFHGDGGMMDFVNKCIKYTFFWLQQSSPPAALATVAEGLAGWIEYEHVNMIIYFTF